MKSSVFLFEAPHHTVLRPLLLSSNLLHHLPHIPLYFRVADPKTSCSLRCTCHCRMRRRRSCLLASQPQAIHWTLTQRLPKNPNLRTTSIRGIGAGFRDGPPCLLTWWSTCAHSYGYLSLKFSNHTTRSSEKGLAKFAICVRMSAALNDVVALKYLQEPA